MPGRRGPTASRTKTSSQAGASGRPGALSVAKVRPGYQQVADQLRELILEGRINAGERLPTESELTEMFGASRSTVREALRILSSQNLIVTARGAGGGTFVSRPEPRYVSDFLEASFGLLSDSEHLTVDHLLEAREILEVPAAGLAAARRTEEHLTALRSCFPARDDASRAHLFEGNLLFHITIVEAAGNMVLPVITRPIFSVLRTRFLRDAAPPAFWRRVARDHRDILAAIEDGSETDAKARMERHLENLRPTYEEIDVEARRAVRGPGQGPAGKRP
ncbi:MAG TPA: FadR/GntR family transcriptional regulator [Actinomycetota bacterium]|nr:FadR/GntR family transcriptional regulator [Actinomycetota bacterium]